MISEDTIVNRIRLTRVCKDQRVVKMQRICTSNEMDVLFQQIEII